MVGRNIVRASSFPNLAPNRRPHVSKDFPDKQKQPIQRYGVARCAPYNASRRSFRKQRF